MSKIMIISILCLSSILLSAQDIVVQTIPTNDTLFMPKLTGSLLIERKQYVGSQYLNEDWASGTITLNSGEILNGLMLKYSGLNDELIWLNTHNYGIVRIDKQLINEFSINLSNDGVRKFKKMTFPTMERKDSLQTIFLESVIEDKLSLYVARKIKYAGNQVLTINGIKQKHTVLEPAPVYYIQYRSSELKKLKRLRKKDFISLFPSETIEINSIFNKHHLRINNETDLIMLISLMNEK